ncbi:MAG: hypothetical protein EOP61_04140 [Sphingomonadales bacterium]|nr:MAG: hypothetical protein EOP61_04140 [Sphingomonadales bacterium]
MFSRKLAALAAASLVFASTSAGAQSAPQSNASKLSLDSAKRADTKGKKSSKLAGPATYIVGAILLGGSIWGLTEATARNRPDSP